MKFTASALNYGKTNGERGGIVNFDVIVQHFTINESRLEFFEAIRYFSGLVSIHVKSQ